MDKDFLENAKLWISIIVPLASVLLGGYVLHRIGKRFETKQWISQKLLEKRLAIYSEIAPALNQVYCFFMRQGEWRSLSPAEIIALKRRVAGGLHPYFPLFTRETYEAFTSFEDTLFQAFNGPGQNARLKLNPAKYRATLPSWTPTWEPHFSASGWSTRKRVFEAYKALVLAFARDAGIEEENAWQPKYRKLRRRKGASESAEMADRVNDAPGQATEVTPTAVAVATPTFATLSRVGDVNWSLKIRELVASAPQSVARDYLEANVDAVQRAMIGRGPDSDLADPVAGACAVVNIASVHIPSFVQLSIANDPKPYKNGYDLGKFMVGTPAPPRARKTREIVDAALPLSGRPARDYYYCAVELNGAGIRFYGDVALVLKSDAVDPGTVVLDRNSFDLMRQPLLGQIERATPNQGAERQRIAVSLAGRWGADLPLMAAAKVVGEHSRQSRRLTTGQISNHLLEDEDYLEVLRFGSFGVAQLREARLSSNDVAVDARIGDRARIGPAPAFAALLWRHRRRRAERMLRSAGVPVTVVSAPGRTR